MKSATRKIEFAGNHKLLCSALLVTAAAVWMLTGTAQATPSYTPSATQSSEISNAPEFKFVQADNWNVPAVLDGLISTVPESLKLDLNMRVNRMFKQVFGASEQSNNAFAPFSPIDHGQADQVAELPDTLIPLQQDAVEDPELDDMGWSLLEGTASPLQRQMYRTDI